MLKTILVLIVFKMGVTVSWNMESTLNGVQLRCLPKEVCFIKENLIRNIKTHPNMYMLGPGSHRN